MTNRAKWMAKHERVLVDLLHEHNVLRYRTNNGWSTERWSKITKEFNQKFPEVKLSKGQIQEHEAQLKKDYKLLKEIRKKSGVAWDNKMGMIITSDEVWDEIIEENAKARKFRHRSFPLFESLDQLYEGPVAEERGHLASIKHNKNVGSGTVERPTEHIDTNEEREDNETSRSDSDEPMSTEYGDHLEQNHEEIPNSTMRNQRSQSKRSAVSFQPSSLTMLQVDGLKRSKSSIQETMETYPQFRIEQAHVRQQTTWQEEFSISKCISVLLTMVDVSDEEKVEASDIFKDVVNREIFLSFEPKLRTLWLKRELAKLALSQSGTQAAPRTRAAAAATSFCH